MLNRLRYAFEKGTYRPINVRHIFEIISRRKKSPPFFIQVGSFDGVSNDPIHEYVKNFNWKGILVEPMPPFFEKLKKNYSDARGLIFENVGVGDKEGEFDFYHLPAEYNEPQWLQQIGSFSRDSLVVNLKDTHPDLIGHIQHRRINAVTLNELMRKHTVSDIDVLNIDAEGFEYRILKDMNKLASKPCAILFEWGCMNKNDLSNLLNVLQQNDYTLFTSSGDMVALHKTAFEKF